ncbi:MAG: aminotransferase class IV [Deltaproteobacteria bacterium]|nr:aminotransferase class IV [Deltaproteobacteria bacterium]
MDDMVFLNGRFLPADKAVVSIFDRGFTYGDGLFETMRSYNGMIFALDLHLKRLIDSARLIGIPIGQNKKYLTHHLEKLLEINNLTIGNAYIKLIVTRGVDYGRLLPSGSLKPTIAIITKPLDAKIKQYQQKGLGAIFLSNKRSLPYIKSLNLLPTVAGLIEAKRMKMQEGIFTDGDKILEGAVTNIFVSDGKGIKTPPIKDGILPGITRRIVIELAKRLCIKITETSLTKNELLRSKEAFLTNSIMGITPLLRIEDKLIGNGKPGALTKRLQQAYKDTVLKRLHP